MAAFVDVSSIDKPIITITRTFDAPREKVWEAITDPKHVVHWYGAPGFSNPVCEMDLRPGGVWHHVMQAPNGARYTIDSVFLEVVPPEKLVWKSSADEARTPKPPGSVSTVTLEQIGVQTKWMLVARFETMADRDLTAKMGFGHMISQGLERLAEHLAKN